MTGYGSPLSNVYQRYCIDGVHNKPMVVTETSALYLPNNKVGNTDLEIKSAWWEQVCSDSIDTLKDPVSNAKCNASMHDKAWLAYVFAVMAMSFA